MSRLADALLGAMDKEYRAYFAIQATSSGDEVQSYLESSSDRRRDGFLLELSKSKKLDALSRKFVAEFESRPFCAPITSPTYAKGVFRISEKLGDILPSHQMNLQNTFVLARSENAFLTFGIGNRIRCHREVMGTMCDIEFKDMPAKLKDLLEADGTSVTTLACLSGKLRSTPTKMCMGPVCIKLTALSSARVEFRFLDGDAEVWRTSR